MRALAIRTGKDEFALTYAAERIDGLIVPYAYLIGLAKEGVKITVVQQYCPAGELKCYELTSSD